MLARREDLGPDEAARALAHIEDEFWGSKTGQKLPARGRRKDVRGIHRHRPGRAALLDSGLKRHYKAPETLHALRPPGGGSPTRTQAGLELPEIEMPA